MNEAIEPVYLRVAEALKFQRLTAGFSQLKMSEVLQIPLPTYRAYETGSRRMQLHTLIDIARYFKLSVNYFMDYGQDDTAGKNRIVIEMEDTDVIHALTDLQGMGKECRESVFEFMEFAKTKYRG